MGHVMKDCLSRRAFIATNDGRYVSASDVEDDLALATNHVADSKSEEEAIDPMTAAAGYKSILVQCVLSTQLEHEPEKLPRHNLFNMFLIVKDCGVRTIIDSGIYNNLVSSDLVKKLGLTTRAHPKPYHLKWFNNSGKAKVTRSARMHFFIGSYHDYTDFDVVPMQACSFLLGCPWKYDTDALQHGRTNTYILMHKGKKTVLLPLTPVKIVKHDKKLVEISNNDHTFNSFGVTSKDSTMTGGALLANTSLNAENFVDGAPCRTMLCRHISFSHDPTHMSSKLLAAVTNLLQEFDGGMESRMTPIYEGEDDADITMLDTPEIWSSTSYKSSPTWSSRLRFGTVRH
jgi:hypothetical protein